MRVRGHGFHLDLPVLGVAGGIVMLLSAVLRSSGGKALSLGIFAALLLVYSALRLRLLRARDTNFQVWGLFGSSIVPRDGARLAYDTRYGSGGNVTIEIRLLARSDRPTWITAVTAFGYRRTERRARKVAEAIARDMDIPLTSDGLESPDLEIR